MSCYKDAAEELQNVIEALCAPNGCEWDRGQTPESLCEYLLEETYELVDAIKNGTIADIQEELGDVLFLLFFIRFLYAKQETSFSIEKSLSDVTAKMIRRHPHVFEGVQFPNLEAQLKAWEEIKKEEKEEQGTQKSVFSSLPVGLPALIKAYRIHSKSARADFTWDSDDDALQQTETEWLELHDALQYGDIDTKAHELGDLIFCLVELGRRHGIKANAALEATNARFLQRFVYMEEKARTEGKDFSGLSMDEKNMLWGEAKTKLS